MYREQLIELHQNRLVENPLEENLQLIDKTLFATEQSFDCYASTFKSMIKDCHTARQEHDKVKPQLERLITQVEQDICDQSDEAFEDYKEVFTLSRIHSKLHELVIIDSVKEDIINKVELHGTNWRYPGLALYPSDAVWIKPMTTMDPLYLTGLTQGYVDNIMKEYPDLYKNKMRNYELRTLNFDPFPQAQFGLVFCLWAFKYLHTVYLERAITRIFDLLRPGGVFMFGYNNCLGVELIDQAEDQRISYYNNIKLRKIASEVGYEIIAISEYPNFGGFVELRKPGELKSNKGSQARGRVRKVIKK